jgi:hypothetical protein
MLATPEDEMAGTDATAVAMEQWCAQQHVFTVETFFKNGDSVVKMQQVLCEHFNIACHGKVPCCNTI